MSNPSVPARVGPTPAPPPERMDTMVVLDLLATTRRWRVNEPFVSGQTDGLSRALIACLNARHPVPRWLRAELIAFLLEHLWEDPPTRERVQELLATWRERRST